MAYQNEHYRNLVLFYFKKGKKAAETCRKICAVYGEDAVTERVCQKWFSRFRSGNFSVQDAPRSGRPTEINSDEVKEMVDTNPRYTTRQIADILKISKSSVENHLHQLSHVSRLDVWNLERKRSWGKRGDLPQTNPEAGLHPKKVMLSIWWDVWRAVDFYELLATSRTINWDVYCDQLDKLNAAIHQKRPRLANHKGIVFHHDNARPHTSLQTRQKLLELGWQVLPHLAYWPDLASSAVVTFFLDTLVLREESLGALSSRVDHVVKGKVSNVSLPVLEVSSRYFCSLLWELDFDVTLNACYKMFRFSPPRKMLPTWGEKCRKPFPLRSTRDDSAPQLNAGE
ncbi:hypothetical protein AAG570_009255 [Ranatra chinensis]|uniref:Mos1 transposase HTH domain-containing protein n=1 Tax=Ranatra chinensis TaxID=642074 RepID=A0ABD0YTC2_9HEMI